MRGFPKSVDSSKTFSLKKSRLTSGNPAQKGAAPVARRGGAFIVRRKPHAKRVVEKRLLPMSKKLLWYNARGLPTTSIKTQEVKYEN